MEDAAAALSNNMDESLRLESRLVQAVREGDVEGTKDLLQERLEQIMHPEDVKRRSQLFQKLFNSCVTDFEEGEENYNVPHQLSSARRSSLDNYVMFKFLVTKLQEDDAIMAIAPSLSHEFLFTEFKPVRYTMTWESALANMIASIRLHQTKVNLEILQLANAPDDSEDLEMAKRLFQEQLEQVWPVTPEFRCTFFEGMLDMVYNHHHDHHYCQSSLEPSTTYRGSGVHNNYEQACCFVVERFLENKAIINFKPSLWTRALCRAANYGHVHVVGMLLQRKPDLDVNATYRFGWTALHEATQNGRANVVKELLFECEGAVRRRVRAHEEDRFGYTPLEIAINNKYKDIEKCLLTVPDVKESVDYLYRDRQVYVDAANAILVGAALIASVTFAGWLQPPLGFTPNYQFPQPYPAPPNTYEQFVAIEGHQSILSFMVFNSLSFFFAISTIIAGADAAFPIQDSYIGRSVKSVRFSLKWASVTFILSILFVLGAFASAGFAILPPLPKFERSMILKVTLGTVVCAITLSKFLLFRLSRRLRASAKETANNLRQKFIMCMNKGINSLG